MPRNRRFTTTALLGAFLAGMTALVVVDRSPAVAGPSFIPHRAVYNMTLDPSRGSGGIARAQGKLEFEWSDVCSGWSVSQRSHVQLISNEGQVFKFGWTLSALEAKDGGHYRFFIRRFNADGSTEETRGKARLNGPGLGGTATFKGDDPREVPLPKGALFPTAHSLLLLQAAEQGQTALWRVIFDGSGDDGRFGVNAAISPPLPADTPLQLDSPLLRGQKSWRLNLAYFGMDESISEPEHEQNLRLFSNGIVDEMLLDYKDFVVRADLTTLESLPDVQCKAE